jgi:basic amino acid/polyamine antiporter, APA family
LQIEARLRPADSLAEERERALAADGNGTLRRSLGATQLIFLGIGAIVGAGVFVATGVVAAENAGPAIVLSFTLASGTCLCAGLCYAEFAALVPASGSSYSYVRAAFGPFAGWMIGWCLLLEYLMAAATVAVGWSGYLASLAQSFGVAIPSRWSAPRFTLAVGTFMTTGAVVNGPAVVLLVGLTWLLTRGAQLSVRANTVLVILKLAIIVLFILCAAWYVHPSYWHPFLPANTGQFGHYGWSGVLRGASVIFYAYLGFDAVSTAARETRNPQRNVPLGIIGSLIICTVIYIAFALVLTGIAPYASLDVPDPVSVALDRASSNLQLLKLAVDVGAVLGLTSVVLVLLYGQSRILYAMSQDNLVPAVLSRLSAGTKTPSIAVLGGGLIAMVMAGLFPIAMLGQLISIGTLCAFVFVCAAVLYLRIRHPELHRPFRTPFAPAVCLTGATTSAYLMAMLPGTTWSEFLLWSILGVVVYMTYGRSVGRQKRARPAEAKSG